VQRSDEPAAQTHEKDLTKRKVLAVGPEFDRPAVAWPTLALFFACLALFASSIWWRSHRWYAVAASYVAIFAIFTPLHDSVHLSVSAQYRWINSAVGRVAGIFFLAPFHAFRWVHLQHHKHTNHPEKDPDFWSGLAPIWLTPLRWCSQELHYYVNLPQMFSGALAPLEIVEVIATLVLAYGAVAVSAYLGHFWDTFYTFLLPMRLAVISLAFAFDYIPHAPHLTARSQDVYGCTNRIVGITNTGQRVFDRVLSAMLLYQNYHNIHHLYPSVPFYGYSRVWRAHEKVLAPLTPVRPLFDARRPW